MSSTAAAGSVLLVVVPAAGLTEGAAAGCLTGALVVGDMEEQLLLLLSLWMSQREAGRDVMAGEAGCCAAVPAAGY
jgi:hypothetical protein